MSGKGTPGEKSAEAKLRGWSLVDYLSEKDTGSLHEVEFEQWFGQPDKAGIYGMVCQDGSIQDAIVIPWACGYAAVSMDEDDSFTADSDNIVVRTDQVKDLDDNDLVIDPKDMKAGRRYVAYHPQARDGLVFKLDSAHAQNRVAARSVPETCSPCGSGIRMSLSVT